MRCPGLNYIVGGLYATRGRRFGYNRCNNRGVRMRFKILLIGAMASVGAFALPVSADDFHGYDCTSDCSGHQAGYDWAEQNGISDASDCDGNSQSFIEGCEAYAEEEAGSSYPSDEPEDNE